MAALFPAFLKLEGRDVLVVGAGPVAASKLDGLLVAGARVRVVAPEVRPEFERPGVTIERRAFVPEDVDGAWFVVAAAPPGVNREVSAAAASRQVFVNAVDDVRSATAYLGGVVRRGGVVVAISTSGDAPALAGLLREAIDALIPDDISRWTQLAREIRKDWKAAGVPMQSRRPLLLRALEGLYAKKEETQ